MRVFFRPSKGKTIVFVVLMAINAIISFWLSSVCFGGLGDCPLIYGDFLLVGLILLLASALPFEAANQISNFIIHYNWLVLIISLVVMYVLSCLIIYAYQRIKKQGPAAQPRMELEPL
jgi:hypothetical protein